MRLLESLPFSPNSGIIRTTTPPKCTHFTESELVSALKLSRTSQITKWNQHLASIDEGKSTDDDELMGPLVTEAFEKMKVGKPMKKVESYVVLSNVGVRKYHFFFMFLLCHSNYKNITRIAHSYDSRKLLENQYSNAHSFVTKT